MFGWFRKSEDEFGRSGSWARVRLEHLEREPACIACGRRKDLVVHHIEPYHLRPELELDPQNLATLCGDPCHIVHGHFMNFKNINPAVRSDCKRYRSRMRNGSVEACETVLLAADTTPDPHTKQAVVSVQGECIDDADEERLK